MTGNQLKNSRKKAGMTQQQLADLLEVEQQTVARWESTGTISKVYQKILTEFFKKYKKS